MLFEVGPIVAPRAQIPYDVDTKYSSFILLLL